MPKNRWNWILRWRTSQGASGKIGKNRLAGSPGRKKRWAAVCPVVLLSIGACFAAWTARTTDRHLRSEILQQASLIAHTMDLEPLRRLSGTETSGTETSGAATDLARPDYLRLKQQLARARQAHPACRFLYLMGRTADGRVFFYVDSEPVGSVDESPSGQIYDEATPCLQQVFDTSCEATEGPETDQWGTWVSALIPVKDAATGKSALVLGMDIDAANWHQMILRRSTIPMLLTLCLTGVLVLFGALANRACQLHDTQQRYREVVEDTPLLVCTYLPDTTMTYVNSAYCRFFRCPRNELIGRSFLEWIPPEEHAAVWEMIARVTTTSEVCEHRIIGPNETVLFQRWTHRVILDRAGRPVAYQAIGEDITERRQAEESLREAREFLETAVAQSPSGILIADAPHVTIRLANQAALGIRGGDRQILTGIDVAQHAAHWQTYRCDGSPYPSDQLPLSRAVLHGEVVQNEEVIIRDDHGVDHWVIANAAPIRNTEGEVTAGIVIFHDITDHKRAEEKLRQEKEVSDHIINSLPGLFYIFADNRFVRWNKKWETISGYSAEELGQMYATDFFEGEDKIHIADRMAIVFQEGSATAEADIVTKDGRKIPFYFTGLLSMIDGKPHLIGLGVDVSAQKQTETELARARDAAEAATRAKSEFLANMSHEIRTPMTAILGFSDILLASVADQEQVDAARTIQQNGQYLIGIINDILDLSKIEAGKLEVEHVPCSPSEIIADVVSLMKVRANAKNLPLQVDYQTSIPQTIQSDPTRLRQILINLIGNSIKFTEVGAVRVAVRLLDANSDDPKLQFDVVDSGIGMNEEQMAGLFKPFCQVDTSATRKHGGTGLGLTISQRLARTLGGNITVRSRLSEGSVFSATIAAGPLNGVKLLDHPVDTCERTAKRPDRSDTLNRKLDCRVLLAEDGPDNQRLITFLLKKAGAEVTVAGNGQVALELAMAAYHEGKPFDVVLMDMQMPVLDGYDATSRLRHAGYSGPVVALTAHAMSTDRDKCLDAGCDDYVAKPIDRAELISLVAELTAHQRPVPENPKRGATARQI